MCVGSRKMSLARRGEEITQEGKVVEQRGEMGEGGVVRQDEGEGVAVMSVDLKDEVVR